MSHDIVERFFNVAGSVPLDQIEKSRRRAGGR
jgi:hypothetical protein